MKQNMVIKSFLYRNIKLWKIWFLTIKGHISPEDFFYTLNYKNLLLSGSKELDRVWDTSKRLNMSINNYFK